MAKKTTEKKTAGKKAPAKKKVKRVRKAAKKGPLVYPVTLLKGRTERVHNRIFKAGTAIKIASGSELEYYRACSRFAVGQAL